MSERKDKKDNKETKENKGSKDNQARPKEAKLKDFDPKVVAYLKNVLDDAGAMASLEQGINTVFKGNVTFLGAVLRRLAESLKAHRAYSPAIYLESVKEAKKMIQLLLENGADPDLPLDDMVSGFVKISKEKLIGVMEMGETSPLIFAISHDLDFEIIKLLVEWKADVNLCAKGAWEIVRYSDYVGIKISPLLTCLLAMDYNNTEMNRKRAIVRLLLENKANLMDISAESAKESNRKTRPLLDVLLEAFLDKAENIEEIDHSYERSGKIELEHTKFEWIEDYSFSRDLFKFLYLRAIELKKAQDDEVMRVLKLIKGDFPVPVVKIINDYKGLAEVLVENGYIDKYKNDLAMISEIVRMGHKEQQKYELELKKTKDEGLKLKKEQEIVSSKPVVFDKKETKAETKETKTQNEPNAVNLKLAIEFLTEKNYVGFGGIIKHSQLGNITPQALQNDFKNKKVTFEDHFTLKNKLYTIKVKIDDKPSELQFTEAQIQRMATIQNEKKPKRKPT